MSFCLFRQRTKVSSRIQIPLLHEGVGKVKLYSYKELRDATGDFNSSNRIGEGGFGIVYKGTLKDGTVVAIKVLSNQSTQGAKQFLTEITAISNIIHQNLVKLYGCCMEGNHRILVYNYLKNNSLAQTLLGANHRNIKFSWRTRSKICIGIARGLVFLHEDMHPHVLHRDIKASNILLDKDLIPKISDFGLARLLPSNATHISTRVAGTLGYLAPEYAIRGQVTRKSDVYSFGVLLLEIVTGCCNSDKRLPCEEQFLVARIWAHYKRGELEKMIDSTITDDLDTKEACKFLKVGLLCTQDASKLRPSMSMVVKMLTRESDVSSEKITQPGLLTDYMQLQLRFLSLSHVLVWQLQLFLELGAAFLFFSTVEDHGGPVHCPANPASVLYGGKEPGTEESLSVLFPYLKKMKAPSSLQQKPRDRKTEMGSFYKTLIRSMERKKKGQVRVEVVSRVYILNKDSPC
ncbi:hypothetical protein HPP92_001995 [Vanilla planifolia]|uniref:Protein kinase domain-containing protein n=1 Tax=Vanilla planifolia TaxID=51239 RepID=A0A835VM33_VANPL|nr:hypothetical protein HPP92_001995 [Vanilla planifolia]